MKRITNLSDLGHSFRMERKAMGKTQAQVAKDAFLRRETIIRIEAGENTDTMTLLKAISALGKAIMITSSRPGYEELKKMFNED